MPTSPITHFYRPDALSAAQPTVSKHYVAVICVTLQRCIYARLALLEFYFLTLKDQWWIQRVSLCSDEPPAHSPLYKTTSYNAKLTNRLLFCFLPDRIIVVHFVEYHQLLADLSHRPSIRGVGVGGFAPRMPTGHFRHRLSEGPPSFLNPASAPEGVSCFTSYSQIPLR